MTDRDCQEKSFDSDKPPGPLFSDRFWVFKLGLAVGAFALLCRQSDRQIGDLFPETEYAAAISDAYRGKAIHAWAHKVLAVSDDGFDFETKAGPVHVTPSPPSPLSPKPGDFVSFVGRIVAPKRVVASVLRIEKGYIWKRGLNYGVSILTVLAFLWIVRRRFRWRMSEGLFRSRY